MDDLSFLPYFFFGGIISFLIAVISGFIIATIFGKVDDRKRKQEQEELATMIADKIKEG